MAKSTYKDTITVPGAATDTIADGTIVGGDIVKNFKALADLVHTSMCGNTIVGDPDDTCYNDGYGSVVVGSGYCANSQAYCIATNQAIYTSRSAGGVEVLRGVTIGPYDTSASILWIPSGGWAVVHFDVIEAATNSMWSGVLMITPTSAGTLSATTVAGSALGAWTVSGGTLTYASTSGQYSIVQIGIRATMVGAYDLGSSGDYSY